MFLASSLITLICVAIYVYMRVTEFRGLHLVDIAFLSCAIYALGAVTIHLYTFSYDSLYVFFLSSITLLSFSFGYFLCRIGGLPMPCFTTKSSSDLLINKALLRFLYWFIVIFCLVFIFLVFYKLHGKVHSFMDMRKAIASGTYGYFAPGIVKQVRDVAAPILLAYFMLFQDIQKTKVKYFFAFFVVLAAMLVGGQRMPVLILFGSVSAAWFIKSCNQGKSFRKILLIMSILALIVLILVFVLNLMLGYAGNEHGGIFSDICRVFQHIYSRLVITDPSENARAFPLIVYLKKNSQVGEQWMNSLVSLTPFKSHKSLSLGNQLAVYLGYSPQANSSLGMPTSIYANFDLAGVIIIPAMLCIFLYMVDCFFAIYNTAMIFAARIIFMFYALTWFSPYLFMLNGGIFVILIILWGYFCQKLNYRLI